MTRGTWICVLAVRTQSSSSALYWKFLSRYSLISRHDWKSYVANWPSSRLTTSASSLHRRTNARRTEMTCTAMNNLLSTSTLASSGEFALCNMKPPDARDYVGPLSALCQLDAGGSGQVQVSVIIPRRAAAVQASGLPAPLLPSLPEGSGEKDAQNPASTTTSPVCTMIDLRCD